MAASNNKISKFTLGSTALALLFAVSSAHAVLINTFSTLFSSSTPTASFSNAGLTVNARAYINDGTTTSAARVFTTLEAGGNGGLGVDYPGDTNPGQIDNFSPYSEWLTFTSNNGTITGIYLALLETTEQVRIIGSNNANFLAGPFVDLVSDGGLDGVNGLVGNPDYFALNDTSYQYVSVFAGRGGNFLPGADVFRVRGVEVIPEPSIIALFGLGLAGLGFSGRRKRNTRISH